MPKRNRALEALARAHRVLPRYHDGFGEQRTPPSSSLLAVLRELGAPVERLRDVPDALRQRRAEQWRRHIPPVIVAFGKQRPVARIRLARRDLGHTLELTIRREQGGTLRRRIPTTDLSWSHEVEVDGEHFSTALLPLPPGLPVGYHRLRLRTAAWTNESWLLIAPTRCPGVGRRRPWGLFVPLYALSTDDGLGAANFEDLETFPARGVPGGGFVGTLPLLAAYLDNPFAPSPYTPVSRLFWNDFYVNPRGAEEAARSEDFLAALNAAQDDIVRWKSEPHVDYREQMILRRTLLEAACESLHRHPGSARYKRFAAHLAGDTELRAYAQFRAAVERQDGKTWQDWPQKWRDGHLPPSLLKSAAYRYHAYAQWRAEDQLGQVARRMGRRGPGLYLDLPLGVHPGGYDVWREPASFALSMQGGAPPDRFFTQGQNWGFAPMHPERVRTTGYDYFRRCLARHMQFAGVLRIDHIMGLSRFFWVPEGLPASEGAYVQSRQSELFAVLTIEAHRSKTVIVGEDLGTVSAATRNAMNRRRVYRMSVGQFGFASRKKTAVSTPPPASLACLNTHDTRPFAGYWHGDDITDQLDLGLIKRPEATRLRRARAATRKAVTAFLRERKLLRSNDPADIALALTKYLAGTQVEFLLVNLEDLIGERASQNTPGTTTQRQNWTRRARFNLEALVAGGKLHRLLVQIEEARSQP